jgi:hypothetical protein
VRTCGGWRVRALPIGVWAGRQRWSAASRLGLCYRGFPYATQVDEAELQVLFSSMPGFSQLKVQRGPRGVTCFCEFQDVASAMAVHQQQQVSSSPPSRSWAAAPVVARGGWRCGCSLLGMHRC